MKKPGRHFRFFLIALLAGIALFSAFKYARLLKEKDALSSALDLAKVQARALETEKQNLLELYQELNRKNEQLEGDLRLSEERLAKAGADFASAVKAVEDLNSSIFRAEAENTGLREENQKLKLELSRSSEAKEALEARMSSVKELKKALGELKRSRALTKAKVNKNIAARKFIEGNRGFLMKDGKPNYPAKIKIEVTPLSQ